MGIPRSVPAADSCGSGSRSVGTYTGHGRVSIRERSAADKRSFQQETLDVEERALMMTCGNTGWVTGIWTCDLFIPNHGRDCRQPVLNRREKHQVSSLYRRRVASY
jgi:hypothetical protein